LDGRTQAATGVQQLARTEKTGGVIRIYVGDKSLSPSDKVRGERWCADRMLEASEAHAWSTGEYRRELYRRERACTSFERTLI